MQRNTSGHDPWRAADLLTVAVAAALGAALAQCAYAALRVFVLHRYSWVTRDVVWMAPLSYGLYTVLPTALLLAVRRIAPRWITARVIAFVPLALAVFGTLLLVRRVSPYAYLVLAGGVASIGSRILVRHRSAGLRLARWGTAAAGLVLALAGVGERGIPALRERLAMAGAAPSDHGAPNVLFIILDTVRARNLSLYGYDRRTTPGLERLARESTVFDWAISPSSWTLPSHASMFTSLPAQNVAAGWTRSLPGRMVTLAEVLRTRGFMTAGFVANPYFTSWETGLGQGTLRWDDFNASPREAFWASTLSQTTLMRTLVNAPDARSRLAALRRFDLTIAPELQHERRAASEVVDRFLAWEARSRSRRFYAFLNLFDAHDPYRAPMGWETRFATPPAAIDEYDASIAYEDAQLTRLFHELARRGVLDRTLVIVAADHGEQFGGHGLKLHGNSLYLNSIHVPLLIRWPGHVPAGLRVPQVASLRRVASTITDLAGVRNAPFLGESLRLEWEHPGDETRARVGTWLERNPWGHVDEPATYGQVVSVLDTEWHLIHDQRGDDELYRYRDDPREYTNLIRVREAQPTHFTALATKLDSLVR